MFAPLTTSILKRAFATVSALAALASCTYGERHHHYDDGNYGEACQGTPRESVIDADQALETEPGKGVGVFVEYASGGHWHVYVTCDSELSGFDCAYYVVVQPIGPSKILSVSPDSLESDDQTNVIGGDFAELYARTDFGFDGFFVDLEPGVALNVEAYLDDSCTNHIYWFGDGALHSGTPSMPLDLVPSAE